MQEHAVVKKEVNIKCRVLPGVFSEEREVVISLPDGQTMSAPISKRLVQVEEEPHIGHEVEGSVRALLVEEGDRTVLVELPQPGLSKGPRIVVPKELLSRDDSQ